MVMSKINFLFNELKSLIKKNVKVLTINELGNKVSKTSVKVKNDYLKYILFDP